MTFSLKMLLAACIFMAVQRAVAQKPGLPDAPPLRLGTVAPSLGTARRLITDRRFHDAESELRGYLKTDAESGPARYLLAYALLRQGMAKESLEQYTLAAKLQNPSAEDLKNVGQAYVLLNDYPDASIWMTRALDMDRRDPELWYSLGRLRYSEQKYAEAEQCFQQTLALAPRSVKAENNLGLAYEGLNRPDDSVSAYRQAIAWQDSGPREDLSEQPLLNLAIVLLHRGGRAQAKELLTRALAIAPNDPAIQEQLGQLYTQEGDFVAARNHLEAAVRADPDKSNLHFLLGQAYRHLGMQSEAKSEFDAASRLANPSQPPPSD